MPSATTQVMAVSDFRSGYAWDGAGAYTLKLRHTGSDNRGGGHGAMVTTDVSCTLATNQDQVIFCRADAQANAETYRDLCPCLRARQYKDPPIIVMMGKEDER